MTRAPKEKKHATAHPKRRIFIHCGYHKTGTTSIQVELTRARATLAAKGFLYPEAAVPDWAEFGQHMLPWSLMENEDFVPKVHGHKPLMDRKSRDDIWKQFHREVEQRDLPNVIVSSEEFDVLNRSEIDHLKERLDGYDIHPIFFIRNLADLVESGYRTAVAHSEYERDIDYFIENHRTRLDLSCALRDWRNISDKAGIVLISYDDPYMRRDSVAAFLNAIGLGADAISLDRYPRQNESLPAFVVEIARFMRSLTCDEERLRAWLRSAALLRFRPGANERYSFLSSTVRRELDSRYAAEVEVIAASPDLSSNVYGGLVLPSRGESQHIRNEIDALAYFGVELEPEALPR